MTRNYKRILVSSELIHASLRLPESCRVVAVQQRIEINGFEMIVENSDWPAVPDNEIVPGSYPEITETRHDCGHVTVDWEWLDDIQQTERSWFRELARGEALEEPKP